jgi:hypothetical protein
MKAVTQSVIEITTNKYVAHGPHLWVSKLLYNKGTISSKRIWEEFQKDQTVDKELINSKSFLKNRILEQMLRQGKIVKA